MKFKTIVADPPWNYSGGGPVGTGGRKIPGGFNRNGTKVQNVKVPYPTMTVEEICALRIKEVSEENAHLYLWFTNAFAEEAHRVARAWGFEPKTVITWVKTKKDQAPEPSMKTGYYFRGATEHILFCVRGSLRTTQKPPRPTAFFHPRLPHSVKPQMFFDIAEEQSPGPYLEIFARQNRPGWERFGNEVESTVALDGLDKDS